MSSASQLTDAEDREYRSRKRRPCDRCRKSKQLCDIKGDDPTCGGCRIRRQICTFNLPPLERHTKRRRTNDDLPGPSAAQSFAADGPNARGQGFSVFSSLPVANGESALMMPTLSLGETSHSGNRRSRLPSNSLIETVKPSVPVNRPLASASTHLDNLASAAAASIHGGSSIDISTSILEAFKEINERSQEPPLVPLDPDAGDGLESHFLGTSTFRGLTLRETSQGSNTLRGKPGEVEFRQVSADERFPAYFVRTPALKYGPAPENGKAAWEKISQLCEPYQALLLQQSLQVARSALLPALPIINMPQFERACLGQGGATPYALLSGLVAHAASYIPTLRPLHQQLWAAVLNALDGEFRQPRLVCIQLATLLLSSRPGVNYAQSDITLARCIGTTHVLGLHLDPSQWSLPRWERSLRTRLFWTVLIHDKMRALLMGRPSLLNQKNYSVTMPTLEVVRCNDDRDASDLSTEHRISLEAFLATCALVPVIDRILDGFMTVEAGRQRDNYISRIVLIESIRAELLEVERGLPAELQLNGHHSMVPTASGVRSLQVSILGLKTILHRAELDMIDRSSALHVVDAVFESAMATTMQMARLVTSLTVSERGLFWLPYTFHHLSNAGSLMLRLAAECRDMDPRRSASAVSLTLEYCDTMARYVRDEAWDVAEETLKRLVEPSYTVARDMESARAVYTLICTTLGLQEASFETNAERTDSADQQPGFSIEGFDAALWGFEGLQWLEP